MWRPDLDEISQAQVDAASFLQDFHVTDGDVWHNGKHQRLECLVETVGEALGPGHLMRWSGQICNYTSLDGIRKVKMSVRKLMKTD